MVNWELGQIDVLIIDELSMVPKKIFRHIASTFQQLHVRPVVILYCDTAILRYYSRYVQIPSYKRRQAHGQLGIGTIRCIDYR